jgi:hypothetical protein
MRPRSSVKPLPPRRSLSIRSPTRALHRPAEPVEKIDTLPNAKGLQSLEVIVDGPINHFMFLEGRRHAIDLASSLSALSATELIASLCRSGAGRPASYAQGIKSIVDAIKERVDG